MLAFTGVTEVRQSLGSVFEQVFHGHRPEVIVRAPGRVNLLGGHVDVFGGSVINIAINRAIWVAAGSSPTGVACIRAADFQETVSIPLKHLENRVDISGKNLPRWAYYPAGIAWALQRRGLSVNGMNAVFLGDVAIGAGLSSSAAVEVAFTIAWQALGHWGLDLTNMAAICKQVERDYLGVSSGIQDQFSCLHAQDGCALWLDCRTLEHHHTTLPDAIKVVVCDTNTRRDLIESGYSRRAQEGHGVEHVIGLVDNHVKALCDVSLGRLEGFKSILPEDGFRRARHVVTEIERVERGIGVLARGDFATFGQLMNQSYVSARDDYGSSSQALDTMWEAATRHAACYGARYSGGGEAGAVVALVEAAAVHDFVVSTATRYERAAGRAGTFFAVEPSYGAGVFMIEDQFAQTGE